MTPRRDVSGALKEQLIHADKVRVVSLEGVHSSGK
jgi:hypothetical protein